MVSSVKHTAARAIAARSKAGGLFAQEELCQRPGRGRFSNAGRPGKNQPVRESIALISARKPVDGGGLAEDSIKDGHE